VVHGWDERREVLFYIKLINKKPFSLFRSQSCHAGCLKRMRIDMHQHVWTEPLLEALAQRDELPFVRCEQGLTILFLAGERPYVIDVDAEASSTRAALVELDGLDRALVCNSSPVGMETLPRRQALTLIDAYHEGALALGEPFGVWGAVALQGLCERDVERALERGCVGVSLPAGALVGADALTRLAPALRQIEYAGAPLFVHPGPGTCALAEAASLCDPLWWPALTRYVAEMQAAWFSFTNGGRRSHPNLRVVFSMLAGLAPLHAERLCARGGSLRVEADPLIFYETSSYGPRAIGWLSEVVGAGQLLYGSDRPLVDPHEQGTAQHLDWDALADGARRALGKPVCGTVTR
jgi:hypothetical protein